MKFMCATCGGDADVAGLICNNCGEEFRALDAAREQRIVELESQLELTRRGGLLEEIDRLGVENKRLQEKISDLQKKLDIK